LASLCCCHNLSDCHFLHPSGDPGEHGGSLPVRSAENIVGGHSHLLRPGFYNICRNACIPAQGRPGGDMIAYIVGFGILWVGALAWFALRSYQKNQTADDYIFAGSNLGVFIGLLTFAATLFSTFTFMGMPDFFRVHGVGAWIFLAISDAAMFFFILWFGSRLRAVGLKRGYRGLAGLLEGCYKTRWAGITYFAGAFIFLIPYTAIQISGISIFLNAVFPDALPGWGWSVGIVCIMLLYSEIGGLRAIIYSDAMQAVILLIALWIIAMSCLYAGGGIRELIENVRTTNESLLSVPGPKGLFSVQFLVATLYVIMMIPVTQPQVATRLIIMKSTRKMGRMAVALGVFTFLILIPTVVIGLYGAVHYGEVSTQKFLSQVLLFDQWEPVAALVVIGLLAAAISTADSQIFALGTELRSLLKGDEKKVLLWTRLAILGFGLGALVFSIVSGDQLVLLARMSFAGTALMGPMILVGIFSERSAGRSIVAVTSIALVLFLLSLARLISSQVIGLRIELALALAVGGYALACIGWTRLMSSPEQT